MSPEGSGEPRRGAPVNQEGSGEPRRGAPVGLGEVFAHVDRHREAFVERLAGWVRQPSVSATGQGMPEAAGHARDLVAAAGLEAAVAETAGWPLVLGRRAGPPGAPTVLVYGHYDVQPPDPLDAWSSPPFEPEVRDGYIYARGAVDDKGNAFLLLKAAELLAAEGALPVNVRIAFDGEEETGGDAIVTLDEVYRYDAGHGSLVVSEGILEAAHGVPLWVTVSSRLIRG